MVQSWWRACDKFVYILFSENEFQRYTSRPNVCVFVCIGALFSVVVAGVVCVTAPNPIESFWSRNWILEYAHRKITCVVLYYVGIHIYVCICIWCEVGLWCVCGSGMGLSLSSLVLLGWSPWKKWQRARLRLRGVSGPAQAAAWPHCLYGLCETYPRNCAMRGWASDIH